MEIEIRAPQGQVKEWLITFLKSELFHLYRRDKELLRAVVHLKELHIGAAVERCCTVDLMIYGNSIFVKRTAESYDRVIRDVLKELGRLVDEHLKARNEPPDERTSTVKV